MQVTNSTGLDADYKVTSGGGSKAILLDSWQPLRPSRYTEHAVDGAEPPFEVTFRFKDASGVETHKTVLVDHPEALVLLADSGQEVKVFYPDEKAA